MSDPNVGEGKTVIVTGVSRRIGIAAAVAANLAADGWNVFATWWTPYDASMTWGSNPGEAEAIVAEFGGRGMEADMSDPATPSRIFDAAEAVYGPVRALINVHTRDMGGGIEVISATDLDEHYAVNVRGTYLMCKEFAARHTSTPQTQGLGRIVNFLSGPPLIGSVAYATTKGAAHWMTMSIAGELAPRGITVNAINPGPTDTGWMSHELVTKLNAATPAGRMSTPSDAANMVRFLVSPEGGWVNGQFLQSDGGFSLFALG
jgi:3-oxoacyl-[acyl-carrier protein] reductase